MMWLLLFLFMSCKIDTIDDMQEPLIQYETISQEIKLEGVYKRAIGSQYEVYDFSEQFIISIESDNKVEIIFTSDYTFDEVNIIIDNSLYPHELYADKIIICGYTYMRV